MKVANYPTRVAEFLRKHDVGVVGVVMVVAIVLGMLQNPLSVMTSSAEVTELGVRTQDRWALWAAPWARYLDDVAALFVVIFALARFRKLPRWVVIGVGVWMLALVIGAAHSLIWDLEPVSNIVELFRQVSFPAMLLLAGVTLTGGERVLLVRTTIVIGLINAVYGIFEWFGLRLFNPNILAIEDGRKVNEQFGIPGNFIGWWIDGSRIERVGGLYINPPTAGLALAIACIFAWWTIKRMSIRIPVTLFLALATVATVSRAGWLLAGAGLLIPLVIRLVGRIGGLVIAAVGIAAGGYLIANHGGSIAHLRGLSRGFMDGLLNPLGRGFGFAGNFAERWESHESLLGIGWSAGGWLALVSSLALSVVLLLDIWRTRGLRWEAAASLGVLGAAAFAETASALNGTIPLWLFAGATIATINLKASASSGDAKPISAERSDVPRKRPWRSSRLPDTD